MLGRVAGLSALLALGGCTVGSSGVEECEAYIQAKLRSPSTYKRIASSGAQLPNYYSLTVEYDADNAYGTPIRGRQLCVFPIKDGRPEYGAYVDHDTELGDALDGKGRFAPGATARDVEDAANAAEDELNSIVANAEAAIDAVDGP